MLACCRFDMGLLLAQRIGATTRNAETWGLYVCVASGLFAICVLRLRYRWFVPLVMACTFPAMYVVLVADYQDVILENVRHAKSISKQEFVDLWDPSILTPSEYPTRLNHRVTAYNALSGAALWTLLLSILFKPLDWLTAKVRGPKHLKSKSSNLDNVS